MSKVAASSSRRFQVGDTVVSDDSLPFVIAEIGNNHQGDVEIAKQMIRAAAFAGANAVKFQKRDNKALFTKEAFDAPYASENAFGATYGAHREALEFGKAEYVECIAEAKRNNVIFFATPWDFPSVDFLADLDVPLFKMSSSDLKTLPLLKYVASHKKPMIVSTGGGTIEDVDRAVEVVLAEGAPLTVMQCTAGYPPKFDELNLSVIETFRERYPEVTIGYSGHDSGIAMSVVAYVLGARVIEKHFTLNRAMRGTDHAFSLEPEGLRKMIRDLHRTSEALGDGVKRPYASEEAPLKKLAKMIVAASDLPAGHVLTMDDLDYRAPGTGLAPSAAERIVGKPLNSALKKEQPIAESDVAIG
jgi:N-acetylneuraminate synthase/sialic acid synthase